MVKVKWLVVALFIGVVMDVWAENQKVLEVPSRIDRVMVYSDRALVTRVAKLDNLTAGIYEVTLRDLPIRIQDDSVRATAGDPANLKIIGLDIKTYQLEKPPEEKIRTLQEQLQILQDNLRVIDDNLKLLQAEKEYLVGAKETFFRSAIQPGSISKEGGKSEELSRLSTKDYDEMLKFYISKLRGNAEAIQGEELKRRDIEKKAAFVREELNRLGASQTAVAQKKSVKVSIEVLKDGSYQLTLAYINYGTAWQASYDIRVFPETKEMEITSFGVVSQSSGEDWLNAELSFSTAQPALRGWLPELQPFYVTVPEKVPSYAHTRYSEQLSQQEMNKNELSNQLPQQATTRIQSDGNISDKVIVNQYLPTDTASNFGSVVFRTPERVDVPADGTQHRTVLWQQKLPVSFEYVTTPKISPYVYLKTLGTNKMTVPILRGNINVFINSDFVGNSQTTGVLPDEDFEMTLNVDENIRVTRKLEEKGEQGPGFLGPTKKVTCTFLIKLENYKKENAVITVIDQIPVSQTKDVTVELGKCSDKPVEQEKDGKLTWKFELKPKEVKELTFSFNVYVPTDKDAAFFNASLPVVTSPYNEPLMQRKMKK